MSVLHIRGDDGKFHDLVTVRGLDGKTAYEYALDGGYTGTEAEFAAKLATEIPEAYTLPPATADTLGGMMVGVGLVADEDGRVGVKSARPDTIAEIELEETVKEVIVPLSQPLSSAIIMVYPPELPDDYSMYVYVLAGTITDYETGECGKLYITDAIVLMKSTNRAKVSINVINGIIFAYWDNLPTAHVASGSTKFGNKTLVAGGGISDSIIIRSVVAGHDLLAGTIIKVYGA